MKRLDNELLVGKQFPVAEARGLYRMLSTGSTIEELRELIAVPERMEKWLRAWGGIARGCPLDRGRYKD